MSSLPSVQHERKVVLYLLTDSISSRLVMGQLDYVAANGWDVVVGCGGDPRPDSFDGAAEVVHLPLQREISLWGDCKALLHVIRLVRRVRPDVVNASTPKAGLLGMVAARLLRVRRRVYVVRGARYETKNGLSSVLLRSLERLATACATDVVYVSRSLLRLSESTRAVRPGVGQILSHGSGNGVDVDHFASFEEESQDRPPTIGFVGRLTADKGVDDLVTVFQRVRVRWPSAKLRVLGSFEAGDPIGSRTRAELMAPGIEISEWVDDPRPFYRSVDVVVFSSLREGLPNVVLEAQAAGVPVAAYASTGTVDGIRHEVGGLLVKTGDVDGLADAVSRLVGDRLLRQRLGRQGREFVASRFDRRQVWDALLGVYDGSADSR